MEKISTEDVISCLFVLGYNQADSILVTMIIGKASLEDEFEFVDKDFSETFINITEYDGMVYKLKRNIKLDTNISELKGSTWTVREAFSRKKQLLEYIKNINLQKIVDKKITIIGIDNLEEYRYIFSNKEKQLLPKRIKIEQEKSKVKSKSKQKK